MKKKYEKCQSEILESVKLAFFFIFRYNNRKGEKIMLYFLIVIGVFFLFIIAYTIIQPAKQKNDYFTNLKTHLEKNNICYTLEKTPHSFCDYKLICNGNVYLIKVVSIPNFSEIQINNITTWEIKYGAGNAIGKAQPYKKYATNIGNFMKYLPKEKEIKIVLFMPKPKKIVMYINESEIIFVTPQTNVYGTYMIDSSQLDFYIK